MLKMNYSKKGKMPDSQEDSTAIHSLTQEELEEITNTFLIGDTIVYPFHGIGQIQKIENHKIGGKEISFFVIYLPMTKMSISIPIEQVKSKFLRHLVSKEELEDSLTHLKDKPENANSDWKVRQQVNNALVKNGDLLSTIKVIISLHARNRDKDLPLQERRLYDSSVAMLLNEMSLVLGITYEEAENRFKEILP